MSHIRIVNNEGNPFFKVVEKVAKKTKTNKTLKRKTVPFSDAKPRKKQRVTMLDERLTIS